MTSPYDVFATTPTPGSRLKPPSLLPVSDPAENEIAYQRIFARFVAQLDEADDEHLAGRCAGLEGVEPTPGLVAWAEATRGTLEDLQRRREAHIQAMYDQLEGLWRRLGVPDAAMDGFVDAHRGSTEETVREYESELERMLELKRERMSAFVENARGEIAKLWDELLNGDEERADFTPYFDGAPPFSLCERTRCDFASQMNTLKNSYSFTKRRSGGSRKSDGRRPIFFRASASISTSAERRRNLQIRRRTRAASLGAVHETQVGCCEKKRCASAFIKRNQGCASFLLTGVNDTEQPIVARKGPSLLYYRVGSRSRPPFSCTRREHAADPAQRGRQRRQGESPRGHESACRFRASTHHDTRLGARERRWWRQ